MPKATFPAAATGLPSRRLFLSQATIALTGGAIGGSIEPLWPLFVDPYLRRAFRRASEGPGPAPAAASPEIAPKPLKPAGESRKLEAADA